MATTVKKWGENTRIARELGISPAAVTKLARKGMPTNDVDAARRWRLAHLNPARMRPDPGPSPDTLLQRAQHLVELAAAALERHQLALVADDLRMAMHNVPKSHRPRLVLPFALWRALLGEHAMNVLGMGACGGATPPPETTDACADVGDEDIGDVAYALACGEAAIQ
jgi:hypothetical protein